MARGTRKPVVWSVLYRTGAMMALRAAYGEHHVLPLFSSPMRAQEWMMRMGLTEHYLTPPLWPSVLREMLFHAQEAGFEEYALDPPISTEFPMEVADIDDLLDQVEDLLEFA